MLSLYVDDAAVSSLNVPVVNLRNNVANTLSTVFTKFGPGTLEIGATQTFQGNIELNRGTLSLTAANVLPMFGNLNVLTGSTLILSPGTRVVLNNNNQEFGNISAVNPSNSFQFSAGVLDLGTATLVVGREGTSTTFNAQIIGGVGSRITKVGAGRLTLDNINGNKANTLETLDISQGVVTTWLNDQSWATPTPICLGDYKLHDDPAAGRHLGSLRHRRQHQQSAAHQHRQQHHSSRRRQRSHRQPPDRQRQQ